MYYAMTGSMLVQHPDGSHAYASPPGIPVSLDKIMRKCLKRDPNQRHPTAEDLGSDLVAAMGRLQALPVKIPVKNVQWRPILAVAGVAAVLVLGGLLVSSLLRSTRNKTPSAPEIVPDKDAALPAEPDTRETEAEPPVVVPQNDRKSEMVRIPAGRFTAGMEMGDIPSELKDYEGWEKLTQGGRRSVFLPAFQIDKYEVSNADYGAFVQATGRNPPSHWNGRSPSPEIADHPVVNVTHEDAKAYARWVGKRIPTADEWEKAARGADARIYPWGNTFVVGHCNTDETGIDETRKVDAFPRDESPYGVIGMAGNAAEWTSSVEDSTVGNEMHVVCGGSWFESGTIVSIASFRRTAVGNNVMRADMGFRCAKSINEN